MHFLMSIVRKDGETFNCFEASFKDVIEVLNAECCGVVHDPSIRSISIEPNVYSPIDGQRIQQDAWVWSSSLYGWRCDEDRILTSAEVKEKVKALVIKERAEEVVKAYFKASFDESLTGEINCNVAILALSDALRA